MRKAWSTRARRWLKLMPSELLGRNPWSDSTKKAVKIWVRDNVGIKGEDAILEEGKCPRPYWTEKQMKRRGEPRRKRIRRESPEKKQKGRKQLIRRRWTKRSSGNNPER